MIVTFESLNCPLVPKPHGIPGKCDKCAASLPPRRRRWCSDECARGFYHEAARNHDWPVAREAALHRDGHRCVRCGANSQPPREEIDALRTAARGGHASYDALYRRYQLEVNHKVACMGQHAERSCAHHLDNLETLCATCHKRTTAEQARERADQRRGRIPLMTSGGSLSHCMVTA